MKLHLWFVNSGLVTGVLAFFVFSQVAFASPSNGKLPAELQIDAQDEIQQAELQFAICDSTPKQIVKSLAAEIVKRELRQAYYLETPDRALQARGVIVRYRESKSTVKSSVKKAFELAGEIPREIFADYGAGCEVDAYLSRAKIGCSVKEQDTELGHLSSVQKGFLRTSGVSSENWKAAKMYGPVRNDSYDLEINRARFALDLIYMPDGATLSELSIRVSLADALGTQSRLVEMIRRSGLRLCETQQGVTKKILDHYLGPAT
jgi:hypothetical protein